MKERMEHARSFTQKEWRLPLPETQDCPAELVAQRLSDVGLGEDALRSEGLERYAVMHIGVNAERPDVGFMGGTWSFAQLSNNELRVILKNHNDFRDLLDTLSALMAVPMSNDSVIEVEGGQTCGNVFTRAEANHLQMLIATEELRLKGMLEYIEDAGVVGDEPVLHTPTGQMRLGEFRASQELVLASNLANRGHRASPARGNGDRGMHISHNIAPALAALVVLDAASTANCASTSKHEGTALVARSTMEYENVGLMLDCIIPLSMTAIMIGLLVRSADSSTFYARRTIKYSRGGVLVEEAVTPERLYSLFDKQLNMDFGLVQRLTAKYGGGSVPCAVEAESNASCDADTFALEEAVEALASVLRAKGLTALKTPALLDAFVYATPKRERSVAAASVVAITAELASGRVEALLAGRESALDGFRGMAVAAMLAALAVPSYFIGTIIMPIAGSKEHFLDTDENKCAALQKLVLGLERLYEYALLAPAYSSLSASSMAQASEIALLGNDAPTKLRCAYASMSTYFQTECLPQLLKGGTIAELAAGVLKSAERIQHKYMHILHAHPTCTSYMHIPHAGALKSAERIQQKTAASVATTKRLLSRRVGVVIPSIRKHGHKRRYQLGSWKVSLSALASGGFNELQKLLVRPRLSWGAIYRRFRQLLDKKGSNRFLCMKHTHALIAYGAVPPTTAVYDGLDDAEGPGSKKSVFAMDAVLAGRLSWAEAQGVLPTAMGPTVFGRMHPSAVFESIACILELVLLPAWRVRVELDPCLDSITPDAAPYLVGPHASEVGEAVCCDELGRIGKSIAKAQGLVAASVRMKAGVAGTYWSTPEVEKRKLSELKSETLTAAGELKLVAHYERCSPYSGITAAELCKRELTSAARELRASAHRKALAGSVAIAEELKAEALAQEPSAHTQP